VKRWRWIVAAAVVLAVIVLSTGQDRQTDGSRQCTMRVTAEALNVRSGPSSSDPVVEILAAGAEVSADPTIRNGYRQLGPGRWAAQQYLEPTPGSNCSSPVG
jgi:uncharacterized protein YraI